MELIENYALKSLNTFGIDVYAQWFGACRSLDDWQSYLQFAADKGKPVFILGGGSNVLFTRNVEGILLRNEIPGISCTNEDEDFVYLRAGAGENWHTFVMYCVEKGYGGVENLSLIPGSVGAGPMQNIGAYGVELKDVFYGLRALDRETLEIHEFGLSNCEFDYRSSVFKTKWKDRFVILDVHFRLGKKPVLNTSYGAIEDELTRMGCDTPNLKAVSDAVIAIRTSKLPNPAQIGNAGSFFKNPSIPQEQYEQLKQNYPGIPAYPSTQAGYVKTAAGWLIEQCGWKGYRKADFGVHKNQALVLVNYGNANGSEIYNLSSEIMASVQEKFGIDLEREVNVY